MSSRSLRTVLVVSACLLAAACAKKSEGTIEAADDTEAIASTSHVSRIDQMLYSPVTSKSPTDAASSVAAAQWWPAGCASRAKDATNPAVVHVHLNDCTGPFGLRHHSGDITVVFSSNEDGSLHAQATSSNMTVNGHDVTYSRDADITIDGTTRTVKSTGAWTRVNDRGDTVSHTSAFTTIVDTQANCRTTSGTAQTNVARREIDSTVNDYKICRRVDGTDTCPSGEVTHQRKVTGDTVTIAFDGSNEAEVTGPKGNTVQVALVCVPLADA